MDSFAVNLTRNSEIVHSTKEGSSPGPLLRDRVNVMVHNQELWKRFNDIGNEMRVTKHGR